MKFELVSPSKTVSLLKSRDSLNDNVSQADQKKELLTLESDIRFQQLTQAHDEKLLNLRIVTKND
jgi:hypothetical protein